MAKKKLPTMREYMKWKAKHFENFALLCCLMMAEHFQLKFEWGYPQVGGDSEWQKTMKHFGGSAGEVPFIGLYDFF